MIVPCIKFFAREGKWNAGVDKACSVVSSMKHKIKNNQIMYHKVRDKTKESCPFCFEKKRRRMSSVRNENRYI